MTNCLVMVNKGGDTSEKAATKAKTDKIYTKSLILTN